MAVTPPLSELLLLLKEERLDPDLAAVVHLHLVDLHNAASNNDEVVLSGSAELLCSSLTARPSTLLEAILNFVAENTTNRSRRAYAWMNLGSLFADRFELIEAVRFFDMAGSLFAEIGEQEGAAGVLLRRASLAHQASRDEEARELLRRSISLSSLTSRRLQAIELLSVIELDTGRYLEAKVACELWLGQVATLPLDDKSKSGLERVLRTYSLVGRRLVLGGDRETALAVARECRAAALNAGLNPESACKEVIEILQ